MEPVDLFYSYAHEDKVLRDELDGHLKIMERRGVIRPWHDRCIVPGEKWDGKIREGLQSADLVLLLVSKDFINSDYIWEQELDIAMKRHAAGEATVVPVMLRAVDITGAPFAALQGLPTDFKPVTSWPDRDEAWLDVAIGIRRTVEKIQSVWTSKPPSKPLAAAPRSSVSAIVQVPSGKSGNPMKLLLESSAKAAAELALDPLLDRVVEDFLSQVRKAAKARGAQNIDSDKAKQYALILIDTPAPKRILWVDDRPLSNRFETAALTKLQIEVVTVTSTEAAIERIISDPESFDLVLSDLQLPEPKESTQSAAIQLLRELCARHLAIPVVFYHRSYNKRERSSCRELAIGEGAFGEAVMPDELFELVVSALSGFSFQHDAVDSSASRQAVVKVDQMPEWPRTLKFFVLSDRYHTEVMVEGAELIANLSQRAITSSAFGQDIAKTLFELLIPFDLRDILLSQDKVVFILDDLTAHYPWELMIDRNQPLCVRMGMIRQPQTVDYREYVPNNTSNNVYVFGNPLAPPQYRDLAGAMEEATLVAGMLENANYRVEFTRARLGASEVFKQLFARSFRIIHIAGHGYYSEADSGHVGARAGVVLSDGLFLTAAEIARMDPIPELVFLNCCHLGQMGGTAYNKLAASISGELIRKGVRAVVAAGWPVQDDAALCFAGSFYRELLAGRPFGLALKGARQKTWEEFPSSNTWGAYQAYGDPDFCINGKL